MRYFCLKDSPGYRQEAFPCQTGCPPLRATSHAMLKASTLRPQCPLWVKSRHVQRKRSCPLYPQKRTSVQLISILGQLSDQEALAHRLNEAMSALSPKRTFHFVLRCSLCGEKQTWRCALCPVLSENSIQLRFAS